jgi:uncharacterized protein (UPF0335 family)
MNQRLRDLIQELGEAIHESVAESEQISGVVQEIREHGYEVLLMLEATIGLNELTKAQVEEDAAAAEEATGPFTPNDVNFLRSLRIAVEGETE